MSSLALTLLYLLAAVLGVVTCRSLKLPPMLGYLAAGVLIGPHALALAQNSEGVRHLGEFGVVFLMFAIGLGFSLPKLRAMRKQVFGLGLMQVVLTMVVLTVLLVGGQRAMRWWLTLVARRKSEELFILNLLLVTLGLAWTSRACCRKSSPISAATRAAGGEGGRRWITRPLWASCRPMSGRASATRRNMSSQWANSVDSVLRNFRRAGVL